MRITSVNLRSEPGKLVKIYGSRSRKADYSYYIVVVVRYLSARKD